MANKNFEIKNGLTVAGTERITSAGLVTGTTTTQAASDNTTKLASTAYVTTALAALADSAPSTLNTLNELAAALGDDANYSTTTTNAIAAKFPLAGGTVTGNTTFNTLVGVNKAVNSSVGLSVGADANSATSYGLEVCNSNSNTRFLVDGLGSQRFYGSDSSETARFTNGKLGIGTTNPSSQFVVAASNGGKGIETQVTTHASNNQFILAYDRANSAYLNMELSALNFGIATNNGTNRFKIDSSGNVGIGTSNPSSFDAGARKLVVGDPSVASQGITIAADTNSIIYFADGTSSAEAYMGSVIYNHASNIMTFRTNGFNSAMVIDSSQNVGIGTSTPGNNHAKANNLVVGSGSAGGMAVYNGTAEGWYAFSRDNANNTDAYDGGISYDGSRNLRLHTNSGSVRLKIDGTGDTEIYGNLSFEDNKLLMFGGGQDARLYFDASTNALFITAANGTANTVNITTNNFQIGGATPLISGTANESVVINQDGASNVDFRVESDNQQYNFFCDASSEIIHFGEGTNSDLLTVTPAGVLNGRRHGYHGGQRQHSGQTFKWCEGTGWTNAIKIDWNNPSWGAVCLRITGMYYYNASNNFSIVIGFAGHSSNGSVSYDATSSGAMNWTSALSLGQTATGETTIAQRAGDTTGDVIYRYEWQCYARSDQEIQIIDL